MAGKNAYKQAGRELRPVVKLAVDNVVESISDSQLFLKAIRKYPQLGEVLSKLGPEDLKETIKRIRHQELLSETLGVTSKLIHSPINKETVNNAFDESRGYLRLPIIGFDPRINNLNVNKLGEFLIRNGILPGADDVNYINSMVSIPLRSKNETIDAIAKEMLESKKDMKTFYLSKFYRNLLRKNGLSEKDIIQGSEDALDVVNNYLWRQPEKPKLGGSSISGFIKLNPESKANSFAYLHELTHESASRGTPKKLFYDYVDSPEIRKKVGYPLIDSNPQTTVANRNYALFSKWIPRARKELSNNYSTGWLDDYFLTSAELQANLRPFQMLMVEHGWLPKQMYRMIKQHKLDKAAPFETEELIDALGEDGIADIMANMLKKGGKLNEPK